MLRIPNVGIYSTGRPLPGISVHNAEFFILWREDVSPQINLTCLILLLIDVSCLLTGM